MESYVYILCIMFFFSQKGLELQLAACGMPAWHKGTSINYVHRAQGIEDVYISED